MIEEICGTCKFNLYDKEDERFYCDNEDSDTEEKLREIIAKHYSEILSELEELIDTDEIALIIEVSNNEFTCKLG